MKRALTYRKSGLFSLVKIPYAARSCFSGDFSNFSWA
jgi:hypothetical protein